MSNCNKLNNFSIDENKVQETILSKNNEATSEKVLNISLNYLTFAR